ncbi:MAG TPA: hypothetical protein VIU46_02425 [Gallionellaceae bacterium]
MKSLGGTLFFFGVGSIVLYFLNMQFVILSWIDHWGPAVGWGIRISMAVIGGLVWLLAPKPAAEAA